MTGSLYLLARRRFLPLFTTQMLGAFNDNLFKNAMVLFVVYSVYNDEQSETWFSAIATGVFIVPFFLLSALSGQLADARDKARIIRIVKLAEILIMLVGAAGLGVGQCNEPRRFSASRVIAIDRTGATGERGQE